MIGFLNNILLPFFAAVALPILIHLLTRHRRDRIKFSSLRFLKKVQEKRIKKIRLKQILLLIIRTLAVLAIVAAFTRPTIKGYRELTSTGHDPTSIVVLMDRSWSTSANSDGVSLLTRMRDAAREISTMLETGDDFNIIPFDDQAVPVLTGQSRLISDMSAIVDTIDFSFGGTDIITALEKAREEIDKARTPNREVYVLFDNEGGGISGASDIEMPENTNMFFFPFERSRDPNAGISGIEFPGQLIEVGRPVELKAKVENYSDIPYGQGAVSLFIDGDRVAQTGVELEADGSQTVSLSANIRRGGFHMGYVELPGDLISLDNKRYFTLRIPERLNVLLVGDRATTSFVGLALSSGAETYFEIDNKRKDQLTTEYLKDRDVVIIDGLGDIPRAFEGRLESFVQSGGGLLILGKGEYEPGFLREMTGVDFEGEFTADEAFLTFGRADFSHPVLAVFDGGSLPEVEFTSVGQLSKGQGAFLNFSNGSPAVYDRKLGEGRIILSAFSTDHRASGLVTSGFFLPFLHRSVQYLAGDEARFDEDFISGESLVRQIDDFPQGARLTVEKPDSTRIYLLPRFSMGKAIYSLEKVDQPGIYRVYADSVLVDVFAVNLDTEEARQVEIAADIENLFPDAMITDPARENIRSTILRARYGKELWKLLILIGIFLLLLELLLETVWRKRENKAIDSDFK